jgi:predicted amidohydrolase YtcJ
VRTLHNLIRMSIAHGFQVGTHATGDAAIDAVVAGYLAAAGRHRRRADLRHYVIHADLTPVPTLRAMARHNIGANMNATIKYLLGRTLDPYLGPERVDYQWPYRTALDLGVKVSSASDAPVTPPAWLQGVSGAVLREGQFDGGAVAGEAQRITLREALASYTTTPAWQDRAERWKGRLVPGYVADVCVVDGDLVAADPHDLPGMQVTTTLVDGDVVHDSASSTATRARTIATKAAAFSRDQAVSCLQRGDCCCRLSEKMLHKHQH